MWISQKKHDELIQKSEELLASLETLKNHAYLISIERSGRENIFTFSRNEELYQVRTMGLISDNLPEWKEKLLR